MTDVLLDCRQLGVIQPFKAEAVRSVLAETCLADDWGKQNRLMEEKIVDFQTSFG